MSAKSTQVLLTPVASVLLIAVQLWGVTHIVQGQFDNQNWVESLTCFPTIVVIVSRIAFGKLLTNFERIFLTGSCVVSLLLGFIALMELFTLR